MPSSGLDGNPLVACNYTVCACVMNHVVVHYRAAVSCVIRVGPACAEGEHCGNGEDYEPAHLAVTLQFDIKGT
jgi:hypothetical protein